MLRSFTVHRYGATYLMRNHNKCSYRSSTTSDLRQLRNALAAFAISAVVLIATNAQAQTIAFDQKSLNFDGNGSISGGTSLAFGPDGILYATQVNGVVKSFTIIRNEITNQYDVTASETILDVQSIPNHNDDGSPNGGVNDREVTGIAVGGTAGNVELYVTSSDFRVGGPSGDFDLDTNSGTITRLTRDGAGGWTAVDLVRGLPRSEENHATNGLDIVTIDSRDDNGDLSPDRFLIVAQGGLTNAGSPSNNFAFISEYALSAAVLAVNLDVLEDLPINIDATSGRSYVYDLPTLDDPTRANENEIDDPNAPGYDGIDENDPFGGNDGLNMAMVVPNGPVQIFSPGYRNAYDLVVTESGGVFVTDNGANGSWGGYPANEATPNVNNSYRTGEPGSTSFDTANAEPQVNNQDQLNLVTTDIESYVFGSAYGGHPSPVRANVNAGWYARGAHTSDPDDTDGDGSTIGYFRTVPFDPNGSGDALNPNRALPANWPPVPASEIDVANGDFRQPGENNPDSANPAFLPLVDPDDDRTVTTWQNNTNGIDEYTASNFGGTLQGALIAGKNGGTMHIVTLDADGLLDTLQENFFSGLGGNALGVTAQGDSDIFPGTIWVATLSNNIVVLEPNDFVVCVMPGDPGYDPLADNDFDGYSNQDEEDNGTDPCSGASQPNDFDGDNISDLNDLDDDGDGNNDAIDPSQLGTPLALNVNNDLFSDQRDSSGDLIGYLGLGLTGLMNNGDANPNWLNWIDRIGLGAGPNDILGGTAGAVTIEQTGGTAAGGSNTQEKAFLYTIDVSTATGPFMIEGRMQGFSDSGQLYDFTVDAGDAPPSQGIQIGTGFQDNYIEFVLTQAGFTLREEVNDATVEEQIVGLDIADRPTGSAAEVILFLLVDPATGSVEGQYVIDGGLPTSVGTITAEGLTLDAIQQSAVELAVGLIGTSGAPNTSDPNDDKEFTATWDYLYAIGSAPAIAAPIPNVNGAPGDADVVITLDSYFEDDNGTGNLNYSVIGNTQPLVGAAVAGNSLTISFPAVDAAVSTITIRATDTDTLFVDQSFVVSVSDALVPLVRINAGGAAVTADDGGPDWEANSEAGAASGASYSVNTGAISTQNIPASSGRDVSIPANITDAVFNLLFANERYDQPAAPEMFWTIPVPNGDYEVRLYMGNGFSGTSAPGQRVFDVNIEGGALEIDDIDLSASFGHQVGAMLSFPTTISDDTLNIEFFHNVENPLVNAIEILGQPAGPQTIEITSIPAQVGFEGFPVSVPISASGGDGALNYAAVGLPSGVSISSTTGVISGTVAAGAAGTSPYNVVVTVDDADADSADAKTIAFTWDINLAPDAGDVLFRVNTGGPLLSDPTGDWSEDQSVADANGSAATGTPSPYLNVTASSTDITYGAPFTGSNNTSAPSALFSTERYSSVAGADDNMQYDIPTTSGNYIVNLYFAEIFVDAQVAGARVFDVVVEGQIVADDLDPTAMFGAANAGVISIPVIVSDDNLDIDFILGVQNPAIKGIEVLSADAPANPDAAALFVIDTGGDIDGSSFNGGFEITNNSTNGLQISSVTLDLSTAIMPEFVFDPLGTAGDPTAKCFDEVNGGTLTGLVTDGSGSGSGSCIDPFSAPRGVGGFDVLTIDFNDFDPGEAFEFAVDVDPTSISVDEVGGKASGLEIAGATVTITFNDGSTVLLAELYRIQPDSIGGSTATFLPTPLSGPPGLVIQGAVLEAGSLPGSQNATVPSLTPTARVLAPDGSDVTLLVIEVEKTVVPADPFEANRLIGVTELDATIGAAGFVDIPLSLTDAADSDLNYIAAVVVQPDGRTTRLSTIWRVNYDPSSALTPQALIQVNPGGELEATTFGAGSFIIDNMGADNIVNVSFDLSSAFLPDVVFDPTGTAGDSGAKCFSADSGDTETGLIVPTDVCVTPFSGLHNGIDGDDGYDVMSMAFNDFGPGEVFTFSVDNDPTSIKNDVTSGDAGSISGFELIGSTVTVEFASGAILTASLFDEGSLGGSMAIVENAAPAAPTLSLVGNLAPIALPDASQLIEVTGTPGADVWLLQVDARLYIDAGGGGYDIDPFEANTAMAKVIGNVLIEGDGTTEVPVTLLATATSDAGPDGGINHFIAVEDSSTGAKSLSSNTVVVELDPTVVIGGTLDGTMTLQGRADNGGDLTVTLYDVGGIQVGSPEVVTADANGQFSLTGIAAGTYQVAVKHPKYLQEVQTVVVSAGTVASDFGEARAGDADNGNTVAIVDFSILASTFNLAAGAVGYDDRADFNGDGVVSIVDFSLLASNFNVAGEVPGP